MRGNGGPASRCARHHRRGLDRRCDLPAREHAQPDSALERLRRRQRSGAMLRVPRRIRLRADECGSEDQCRQRPECKLRAARTCLRAFDPGRRHSPSFPEGSRTADEDSAKVCPPVRGLPGGGADGIVQGVRRVALALTAIVSLALAPSAFAWTTLSGGVGNTVIPSMLVTQAGTELVSFETTPGGTIDVSRNRATPKVLVTGDVAAGRTQLVQQPNGAIQLYFPNANGVARLTSVDDGATWTGPIQTQVHIVDGVQSAAVAPDGTPYFTQDGTDFLNVYKGLNGETLMNVYTTCCAYDDSIAVDSTGLVQVAFYSNATANGAFVYMPLGADLTPGKQTALSPSLEHPPRVPLVTDKSGTTYLAWAPGNPATAVSVVPFRGGNAAGDGVTFHQAFGGGDPHMALSVDSSDRLWIAWSGGGTEIGRAHV